MIFSGRYVTKWKEDRTTWGNYSLFYEEVVYVVEKRQMGKITADPISIFIWKMTSMVMEKFISISSSYIMNELSTTARLVLINDDRQESKLRRLIMEIRHSIYERMLHYEDKPVRMCITYTKTHSGAHTRTCVLKHARTCSQTHIARTRARTHARTHARTPPPHTHTFTQASTHSHTSSFRLMHCLTEYVYTHVRVQSWNMPLTHKSQPFHPNSNSD